MDGWSLLRERPAETKAWSRCNYDLGALRGRDGRRYAGIRCWCNEADEMTTQACRSRRLFVATVHSESSWGGSGDRRYTPGGRSRPAKM